MTVMIAQKMMIQWETGCAGQQVVLILTRGFPAVRDAISKA